MIFYAKVIPPLEISFTEFVQIMAGLILQA